MLFHIYFLFFLLKPYFIQTIGLRLRISILVIKKWRTLCNSTISFSSFFWKKIVIIQVGAKSRNISYLKGKVPSWVGIPTSVALPFGVFEKVLSEDCNQVSFSVNSGCMAL